MIIDCISESSGAQAEGTAPTHTGCKTWHKNFLTFLTTTLGLRLSLGIEPEMSVTYSTNHTGLNYQIHGRDWLLAGDS